MKSAREVGRRRYNHRMGLGRRAFLRIFGTALASLALTPSRAVAIIGDDYVNRRLGVAFRKPPGWVFSDVREMGEVAKGQLLQLNDPELLDEIWPSRNLPVLALARDTISASADHFTPGVNVFLDSYVLSRELKHIGLELQSPMEIAVDDIEANRQVLKDFRVHEQPKPRRVSRCEAAEHRATFLFEHANIPTPLRVRMHTISIWQNPGLYTIRMFDAPDNGPADTMDYEEFIETVRMV